MFADWPLPKGARVQPHLAHAVLLAWGTCCLNVFLSCGAAPFLVHARKNRHSLGLFLSIAVGILGLLVPSTPNLRCIRQKQKSLGNSPLCHSLGPKDPSQSALFSARF